MHRAGRNFGTCGLWMQAMSAVDIAWWDLKARLLAVPLATLFGTCRDAVPVYGSGGFTTMDDDELARQVEVWRALGCRAMKIKIGEAWGTQVERDLARVSTLRELAGEGVLDCVQLDVTRCGGYTGFLRCAALAGAAHQQVSAHCAPALHVPVAVAIPNLRHVEYFADHALLEPELVDGAPPVRDGALQSTAALGHGMQLHA